VISRRSPDPPMYREEKSYGLSRVGFDRTICSNSARDNTTTKCRRKL